MAAEAGEKRRRRTRLNVLLGLLAAAAALLFYLHRLHMDDALCEAVAMEDAARAHELLQAGADPNAIVPRGGSPSVWQQLAEWLGSLSGSKAQAVAPSMPVRRPVGGALQNWQAIGTVVRRNTALAEAASLGSEEIISDLISHGADVNRRVPGFGPLLFYALLPSREKCLELLLRAGARTDVQDDQGHTPLHAAARAGSARLCKILLEHGANIDARDHSGDTPLLSACRLRMAKSALFLLECGADPQVMTAPCVEKPLVWAAARGSLPLVQRLWEQTLPPAESRDEGQTALYAAVTADSAPIARYLLERGVAADPAGSTEIVPAPTLIMVGPAAPPRTLAETGGSPLLAAAAGGDPAMCALLIAHGADVNRESLHGTPLSALISPSGFGGTFYMGGIGSAGATGFDGPEGPRWQILQMLVSHGARVEATNRGQPPIVLAAHLPRVVGLLLAKGAHVDAVSSVGDTALIGACAKGSKSAEILVAYHADVNWRNRMGQTPLMFAVRCWDTPRAIALVRLLLAHGARADARDNRGVSVLAMARNRVGSGNIVTGKYVGTSNQPLIALLTAAGQSSGPAICAAPAPEETMVTFTLLLGIGLLLLLLLVGAIIAIAANAGGGNRNRPSD